MFSSTLLLFGLASQCLGKEIWNATELLQTPAPKTMTNLTNKESEEDLYQVSVRDLFHFYGTLTHICTGALINPLYVVTVAQCVSYLTSDMVAIVTGRRKLQHWDMEQFHSVKEIIVHECYSDSTRTNDIALLRLFFPLGPWKTFGYPTLPKHGRFLSGEYQGELYEFIPERFTSRISSVTLQQIPVSIFSSANCKNLVPDYLDTDICAYDPYERLNHTSYMRPDRCTTLDTAIEQIQTCKITDEEKDGRIKVYYHFTRDLSILCMRDSTFQPFNIAGSLAFYYSANKGSLLVYYNILHGLGAQVRIVSKKPYNCTSIRHPMLFTRVSAYTRWIKTEIRNRTNVDEYPSYVRRLWIQWSNELD